VYALYDAIMLYATGVNACLASGNLDIIDDAYNLSNTFMKNSYFNGKCYELKLTFTLDWKCSFISCRSADNNYFTGSSGMTYITSAGVPLPRFSVSDVIYGSLVAIAIHTE
jgi:hypothetical protein